MGRVGVGRVVVGVGRVEVEWVAARSLVMGWVEVGRLVVGWVVGWMGRGWKDVGGICDGVMGGRKDGGRKDGW